MVNRSQERFKKNDGKFYFPDLNAMDLRYKITSSNGRLCSDFSYSFILEEVRNLKFLQQIMFVI